MPSVSSDAEWRRVIALQNPQVYAPTPRLQRIRRVFGFGPSLSTIHEEEECSNAENDVEKATRAMSDDTSVHFDKSENKKECLQFSTIIVIVVVLLIVLPVIAIIIASSIGIADSSNAFSLNCPPGTCQVKGLASGPPKLAKDKATASSTTSWNQYGGSASISQLHDHQFGDIASDTQFKSTANEATTDLVASHERRNVKEIVALTLPSKAFVYTDLFRNIDPCAVLAAYESVPIPIQVLRMCLHNVPYNKTRANKTVKSLINALQFYVFLDTIKTRSPLSLPNGAVNSTILPNGPFDIVSELTMIQNTTFQTDYLFESALTTLLKRLHDGHTQYMSCYDGPFVYVAPFPLVNVVENVNGKLTQIVKITSSISSMTSAQFQAFYWTRGLNIADWAGAQVLYIDDQPVLPYLRFWAEYNIALSQDPSADFNRLFVSTMNAGTGWAYSVGEFTLRFRLPPKDNISYVVRKPNNETWKIIAPYYAKVASPIAMPFNDTKSFWNAICAPQIASPSVLTSSLVQQRSSLTRRAPPVPSERAGISLSVATFSENGMSVYVLPSNGTEKVGILAVRDFLPSTADLNGQLQYFTSFVDGLAALKAQNVTKFIISLTQNPGGIACIASYITQYMFGTKYYAPFSNFRYSLLLSNLAKHYSTGNGATPDPSQLDFHQFNSPIAPYNAVMSLYDFSTPTQLSFSGARPAFYTSIIRDNCPLPQEQHNAMLQNATRFNPADFLILTDGQCFSACANFVDMLSKGYGIKTVGYGGILNHPMRAGNSYAVINNLNDLVGEINSAGLNNDTHAPTYLDTKSEFTLAIRQLFPADANLSTGVHMDLPAQFKFTPVDYRILPDEQTASDIRYVWQKAAHFF